MFYWLKRLGQTIWYTLLWLSDSFSIIPGLWHVFRLRAPRVTFFGGAMLKLDNPYTQAARELAALLVHHNVSIITGGGGGIMEAAAIGAKEGKEGAHVNSLGIGVSGLEEGEVPAAHGFFVRVKKFVMRKWLMINFSSAYIVFPGGVGTYDELAEILTLMDAGKLRKHPMILYGKEYWDSLEAWAQDGIERGFINPHIKEFFIVTNDVQRAFELICKSCESNGFKIAQ